MAALTLIYWSWAGVSVTGYGRGPGYACNAYSAGGYPTGLVTGGSPVYTHCTFGTNGTINLTATVTCPAETIPDYNSGYCVPYLNSTVYTDALKAITFQTSSSSPPPSGGGSGTYALPDMTIAEGTTIGMAIVLAWASAWGFRQIAKAIHQRDGGADE